MFLNFNKNIFRRRRAGRGRLTAYELYNVVILLLLLLLKQKRTKN